MENEEMITVRVGIDCEPCTPRPDTYIGKIEELLNVEHIEPSSMLFGAWEWYFKITNKEVYTSAKDSMRCYLEELLDNGWIRGYVFGIVD